MEQWESVIDIAGTRETATVTGRVKIPLGRKLNPLWWFGNDPEPTPPDWYLPARPRWWRVFCWYVRNPLVNLNDYVIGVCDKNYAVTGPRPVLVPDWLDVEGGRTGFKWSLIHTPLPRPFVSYTGKKRGARRVLWHFGWGPGGNLATKFNITKD